MDTSMLHTFVVVAYQESEFLEICLQSLINQRTPSQILITTSTPSAFLSALAKRFGIQVVVNLNGGGIAADWNFAYAQAKTPYVTLAHQDDFYEPDYTEAVLATVQNHPDTVIAFTNYRELHGEQKKTFSTLLLVKRFLLAPFWLVSVSRNSFLKHLILSTGNPVCCPSVWFHKARIGPFIFSNQYRVNLDWEAWRRLAGYKGSFVFMRKALVCHRKHEQSESTVTLTSDIRKREDTQLLSQSWGTQLGSWISAVYALGYRAYKPLLPSEKS
jgi:glycosyltransferase involved in cell wall biosynthesis